MVRYKMVNSRLKLCNNAVWFILQDFVVEREMGLGSSFRKREKHNNLFFFTEFPVNVAKVMRTDTLFLSTSPLKIGLQMLLVFLLISLHCKQIQA